jgi:hypothetical protein
MRLDALPPSVRHGSQADREVYRATLGFERVLLEQMLETSVRTGPLAEGPWAGEVRGAVADAVVAAGGVGLSGPLFHALRPEASR